MSKLIKALVYGLIAIWLFLCGSVLAAPDHGGGGVTYTANSRTEQVSPGVYRAEIAGGSLYYQDGEGWEEIDTTIELGSEVEGYDYSVTRGLWSLYIGDDSSILAKKGGFTLSLRLEGLAYLEKATGEYVIIHEREVVGPVLQGNSITYPGIFPGVDLIYYYQADNFKTHIRINETARAWATSHPPSSYGLNNADSYLVAYYSVDWALAYPAESGGEAVTWGANRDLPEAITFKSPLADKVIAALPANYAYPEDDPDRRVAVHRRFIAEGGENYLLLGANVLALGDLPPGPIIIDPDVDFNTSGKVDGYAYETADGNWTTIRAAGGSASNDVLDVASCIMQTTVTGAEWSLLSRMVFVLNTSALPDDAIISSATFSLYGNTKLDEAGELPELNIYSAAPASDTALVAGDYDSLGDTPYCDTPVTYAAFTTTGYNDFALNATGLAAISKTGNTYFGGRMVADGSNVEPVRGADEEQKFKVHTSEKGAGYLPTLSVTYSLPSPPDVLPPSTLTIADDGASTITANWTNAGADTDEVVIRIKRGAAPTTRADGELFYSGNLTTASMSGLDVDFNAYYLSAWGYDTNTATYSDDYTGASVGSVFDVWEYIDMEDIIILAIVVLMTGLGLVTAVPVVYAVAGLVTVIYGFTWWTTSEYLSVGIVVIGVIIAGLSVIDKRRRRASR